MEEIIPQDSAALAAADPFGGPLTAPDPSPDYGLLTTDDSFPRDFLKLEKNLASLGFFSPKSKTLKSHRVKRVQLSRLDDKTRVTAQVTIEPSVSHGLPTTAHQDKTFALQKIIQDRQSAGEKIENPIGFTSAEILRLLGHRVDAGKNYVDVDEWLNVMTATTVISEGAVYLAGRRTFAKDRFHVFDRAVTFGKELPDGTIADRNYVWLSDWQLENINKFHYLPIDFDAYKRLKNPIAKTLIPLLQVWFFATQTKGIFEKRYDEFCQQVGVREYAYLSKVKEKLGPALEELAASGYLKAWDVIETPRGFKVVLWPGLKFFADRDYIAGRTTARAAAALPGPPKGASPAGSSARGQKAEGGTGRPDQAKNKPAQASLELPPPDKPKSPAPPAKPVKADVDMALVDALVAAGVSQEVAMRLAMQKPDECRRQLAYLPYQKVEKGRGGFLRSAIEGAYAAPAGYAEQKKVRERAAREQAQKEAQQAQRGAVVQDLRSVAEKLLTETTAAEQQPLVDFMRRRKERDQKAFKPGSPAYRAIEASYESESLQLQLIVEFYAAEPCPLPDLASFIQKHGPDLLKKLVNDYYGSR